MASIGSLVVNITGKTGGLTKALGASRVQLASFGSAVSTATMRVGGLAAALTGVAGIAGIGMLVRKNLEAIDTTGKLADSLGIGVQNLVELRHAAELTGLGAGKLDTGLQRLAKTVGEAAVSGGTAKLALDRLGLSVADLVRMSPDQQFRSVADAIKSIENPTLQAQAAMSLFGRDGATMVNMLREGSIGLDAMGADARRLGKRLSEIDVATVAETQDAVFRAKEAFASIGSELALNLAPMIKVAADRITDFATQGTGAAGLVTGGIETMVKSIGVAADVIDVLGHGFRFVQAGITKGLAIQVFAWGSVGKAIEKLLNMLPGVEVSFGSTIASIGNDLNKLAGEQFETAKQKFAEPPPSVKITKWFDDLKLSARSAGEEMAAAFKDRAAMREFNSELADAAAEFEQLSSFAKGLFDKTRSPIERFEANIAKLGKAFEAGLVDENTFGRAVSMFQEEFEQSLQLNVEPPKLANVEAMLRGSAAEVSFQAQLDRELQSDPVEKFNKEQVDLQKRMARALDSIERINDRMLRGQSVVVAGEEV